MSNQLTLPIAETFTSIQGEGSYAGQKMYFVRLAGCNVGRYPGEGHWDDQGQRESLFKQWKENEEHSICTTALGKQFLCDTNYHKTKDMSFEEIKDEFLTWQVDILLFTGGEPLLQVGKLRALIEDLTDQVSFETHLETSGTLPIPNGLFDYVTCSPKSGYLSSNNNCINQWKFVVTSPYELQAVRLFCDQNNRRSVPVYISPVAPISFDLSSWKTLLEYFELAKSLVNSSLWQPYFRLNLQQHKLLGER